MGYCIKMVGANFKLDPQQQQQAYKAWSDLYFNTANPHYKYMDGWVKEEETQTFADFLEALGFSYKQNSKTLRITGFDGKLRRVDTLFEALAGVAPPGSYVAWRGEDKGRWAYVFNGQKMLTYDKEEYITFRLQEKLQKELPGQPHAKRMKI